MKKILFVAAACILAAACKPTETETTTASLEVTPTSLSFAAEDTAPQTITVTAVGVEWTYSLAESGKEWVTIERLSDKELTVAVADNTKAEQRTAAVTFKAKDNNRIKDRSVTIIQQGAENPEVYALTVDPTVLTFEAEGAAGQSVKVTASGEGMTWSAAVEDAAKEWITLSTTEGSEGETTLTVTVQDNPDTAERSANVTLTPSVESVGPKAIRVTQEAKVLPPSFSMSYEGGELPAEGFVADYKGSASFQIAVTPVNVIWDVKTQYESGGNDWLQVSKYESETVNLITINFNLRNDSPETRTATITVTTDAEGIGPFEIKASQQGKPDFLSTITEDVSMNLTYCYALVEPNNDYRNEPSTLWDLRLWSDGITYDETNYPNYYVGTGEKLCVYFYSDPLTLNDDNEYYLPDGTYTVTAFGDGGTSLNPGEIRGGGETWNYVFPQGSWYSRVEESNITENALISEGTATVTRNGEVYTITFDFTSDAKYSVTGTFEGEFEIHVQG